MKKCDVYPTVNPKISLSMGVTSEYIMENIIPFTCIHATMYRVVWANNRKTMWCHPLEAQFVSVHVLLEKDNIIVKSMCFWIHTKGYFVDSSNCDTVGMRTKNEWEIFV